MLDKKTRSVHVCFEWIWYFRYRAKWPGHPAVEKQFSPWYRFAGVFIENGKWKRLLRHPVLAAVMYFERFLVALTYLVSR